MSNLVLYRKYRPQTFAEITGQAHVVQTLSNAISDGVVSHAYLFCGPRGSGKTTIARILAKAVNCQNRKPGQFEPCNKCSSCEDIMASRSMDLIEIDAASNRGIDEIRELRENIKFSPVKEKYKVFIFDEAHQLTKEAANAILKTLEEPPDHAIFILATTEAFKMIPTIISRCQRFDFRKFTNAEIISRLEYICQKEKAKIEKSALELIALNSGGAIRDAESLLDQALAFSGIQSDGGVVVKTDEIKDLLGLADVNTVSNFVDFLSQKDAAGAINFLSETLNKGKDAQEFAKSLIRYLRQAMLVKLDPSKENTIIAGFTGDEKTRILNQVQKFSQQELQNLLNLFLAAENKMKYSSIPELPLELAIVEFCPEKL